MTSKSALPDDLYDLKGKDLETYGFARVRDLAYDAVQELWQKRKAEGWTQMRLAENLGRDTGWLSRKLQGPGNWTFRTFGALVQGLNGELEMKVHPVEETFYPLANWHAYVDYGTLAHEEYEDDEQNLQFEVREAGPVIKRAVVIQDDTILVEDTTRREDIGAQNGINSAHLSVLEPAE